MIIDRLRVRGKLNLLLLLPLTAVVLVAVPFVAGQIGNARSSTATADAARNARQLGAIVWELQRERLVTAGYLANPNADDAAMVLQQQIVSDDAESLRQSLGDAASDEMSSALVRLGSLAELRQSARHRGVPLDSVARAYHAVIDALIDALRLVPQRTSDAEGTRQLTALDALLRANEESALRGMALVAAAVNPQVGRDLLATASAQSQMFTERFVQQADADQAGLVVLVDQGEAARRVDALVQQLPRSTDAEAVQTFVASALAAAEAQAALRRLVQDRVTSQIADAAGGRAGTARAVAWSVGVAASLLFALVIGLVVTVSRSIANPLLRLTRAAATVADLANAELVRVTDVERVDEQPPRLAAIDVASSDEVGDLAVAFNRVQATAALLLERQVVTRRNVSLMFANVAQRTQNLVRRQLALVDELERDEQNTRLLTRLYRLDHLSTRLRRNADNLLVVAGSHDGARIAAPALLSTVMRSALAEIEDYQRVTLGAVHEGTVAAALVSDLVLVFAELLENATAFSPPESTVEVHAKLIDHGWCQVSVVDHGIGMTAQRLAEENRRLVERERLDIVPTSVLGLFVVGRLARRHGLAVELVPTSGQGTTATVAIPPSLYVAGTAGVPMREPTRTTASLSRRPAMSAPPPPAFPAIPSVPGRFLWFATRTAELPAVTPGAGGENGAGGTGAGGTTAPPGWPTSAPAHVTAPVTAAGQLAPTGGMPTGGMPTGVETAASGAAAGAPAGVERRGNLNRRVPGAQLPAAVLRTPDQAARPTDQPPAGHHVHDPAAARNAMDAFQDAVARAAGGPPVAPPSGGAPPLSRRQPGASLAPELRNTPSGAPARQFGGRPARNPDAERASFDGYAASLAEARRRVEREPTAHEPPSPRTKESRS
jgi:signal transduction histidine kinase